MGVNFNHRILTVVLAGWSLFAQGADLTLPTRKELQGYAREANAGPCDRCAEVISIETIPGRRVEPKVAPAMAIPGQPLHGVQPVPILTKDARAARQDMLAAPPDSYKTIVRNDDGTYAAHEQETRPDFVKGDRVRVTSDGLVRQP